MNFKRSVQNLHLALAAMMTLIGASVPLAAQTTNSPTPAAIEVANESNERFTGWGFGAGLSVTYDTGSRDRVTEASIDANGIVRVDKKENVRARLILETHFFFPYKKPDPGVIATSGWGPFVAVQPGENDIIKAAGIGVMFGWRRPAPQQTQSFNLGIGYIVDPNTKVLGDEFRENQPAPMGPDGNPLPIRMPEMDQGGILAIASFSW